VPIPGTTKQVRLEENAGSSAVELTRRDLGAIDDALQNIAITGERYTEQAMKLIDR
jgi:diketogulonate reductase-like aldo/keto reductase